MTLASEIIFMAGHIVPTIPALRTPGRAREWRDERAARSCLRMPSVGTGVQRQHVLQATHRETLVCVQTHKREYTHRYSKLLSAGRVQQPAHSRPSGDTCLNHGTQAPGNPELPALPRPVSPRTLHTTHPLWDIDSSDLSLGWFCCLSSEVFPGLGFWFL